MKKELKGSRIITLKCYRRALLFVVVGQTFVGTAFNRANKIQAKMRKVRTKVYELDFRIGYENVLYNAAVNREHDFPALHKINICRCDV